MSSLPSLSLDAFVAVAQTRSFSKAAEKLFITQSALSQRVLNLEDQLQATLFLRDRSGVQLTEIGVELLRACQGKEALESEFLSRLHSRGNSKGDSNLVGEVRIGGFSSVMRSVILPSLAPLLKQNPGVRLHFLTRELRDLPELFYRGEIDWMVLDQHTQRDGVESVVLGVERNVLVRAKELDSALSIYLDHDEADQVTHRYLKLLGESSSGVPGKSFPKLARRYLGEVYSILEGVKKGIGLGVLPKHLIRAERGLEILHPEVELVSPVVLYSYAQPYTTRLRAETLQALQSRVPNFL